MTAAADDHWVTAAMSDDAMVVDLLVRLHGAAPPPPQPAAILPLDWSVRQRRSKPLSASSSVVANTQKNQAHQRASPTTPLSWSGATSISGGSGGAGGEESSSRPLAQKPSSGTRSKGNGDGEKTASKRSRKKKTLAELQVEENSLQEEKRELKRDIAAVRVNLERQRATNENLKRMKMEFQSLHGRETSVAEESTSDRSKDKTTEVHHPTPSTTPPNLLCNNAAAPSYGGGPELNEGTASNPKFVLPDLNIPFEEAPCPNAIWSGTNYA